MAEEIESAENKSGSKGLMVVLIVLIVVLLLAVGGMAYFLFSKGVHYQMITIQMDKNKQKKVLKKVIVIKQQ
jgi:flagellar basal body-associated protein FliL